MSRPAVKIILVPTDFSDCSRKAVDYAIDLSGLFKAKIILLHVLESSVYSLDVSLMPPGDPFGLRQKLVDLVNLNVEEIKKRDVEAEGACIIGVPPVEIIKAVKKYEADMIIMGTHGRTGLAHILLGSTAERVIQRAECPVLTVRTSGGERTAAQPAKKKELTGKEVQDLKTIAPGGDLATYCHLCALPSTDVICDACKARVQAEAHDRRQRLEKESRADSGRR
ncbi:MAG TPA: universal stress protein [Nitrospiria bacterium]|nr:universal stress protein [Nitrospiria bacterium]